MVTTDQNQNRSTLEISKDGARIFKIQSGPFVPIVNPKHPFYHEYKEAFDVERYQYPRPPIDLGHSRLSLKILGPETVNIMRMPIKYPLITPNFGYQLKLSHSGN